MSSLTRFIRKSTLVELLGYAGLIPFVGAAVLAPFGVAEAVPGFVAYSAMILAFMAGGCWGVAQSRPADSGYITPVVSIGVFLWGLAAFWFVDSLGTVSTLTGLMAGYIALFLLEQRALFRQSYSDSYKKLRRNLSAVVVSLHLLLLLMLTNNV